VNSIAIYDRVEMFKTKSYWNFTKNNPFMYVLDESFEILDIDTTTDFSICEAIYKEGKHGH
jgi:CMP-N-acetylneuraminic acid synthetase